MTHKIERTTHTIDATDQIVGRLASRIAHLIMGKGKRTYAPHIDGGDSVIVTNLAGIKITAKKLLQKEYKHYSGYPGGLKSTRWETMQAKNPKNLLRLAIYRMLPKNKLRPEMIKRVKFQ